MKIKEEIGRVMGEMNCEMCERVITNFIDRLIAYRVSMGSTCPTTFFIRKLQDFLNIAICKFFNNG